MKDLLESGQKVKLLPGISFADYCELDAVNVSTLLKFVGRTDRGAKWAIEYDQPDTQALLRGHAVHAAILEPDVFKELYATMPTFGDLRVKANKEAKAQWESQHQGRVHLTTEDYAATLAMRDSVLNSDDPEIRELFSGPGQNELTVVFRDEKTGLLCKGRIDRLTSHYGWPCIMDVKTDKDIRQHGIETALARYNYAVRLAWYMDALSLMKETNWMGVFVWVQNNEAYEVRATQMDDHAYAEGRVVWRQCLDRYAACLKSGKWQSYPQGIEVINPPAWWYKNTVRE